jgi:hypothetical protein
MRVQARVFGRLLRGLRGDAHTPARAVRTETAALARARAALLDDSGIVMKALIGVWRKVCVCH